MSTLPPLSFGALLRRYRRAAGLTQEELAERASLSLAAINTLERGVRRAPRKETLTLLAEALALTPSERMLLETAARQGGRATSLMPAPSIFLQPGQSAPWSLMGRMSELAVLEQHLAGTGPPVLLLAGEPGIGKSRLLQEATRLATERGWTVLEGGCQRRSGQEPFAPLVGALEGHIRRSTLASLRTDLDGCAWLVRLLPELAEMALVPAPSWKLPPEQERRLMFAAVGRFLTNSAGPAGTLLVLDDLQWAGVDALELLTTLIRSSASAALRVLGAYRTTEMRPPDPLSQTLADLAAAGLAVQHRLGPLAPQEASDLFQQVLAGEKALSAALTEQVLSRTGGVPFFLVSCAEALRSGTLVSEEEAVPWTVSQSIRQRVAVLPMKAQDVLGVAAVIGRQMERTVLVAASTPSGQNEEALLGALEELGQAYLFVETREDTYQFPHDLIREVVLADLSAARRASLHRRVAEALEQTSGKSPIERLAYHYARAGLTEKAVFYLERTGDRAWALYANAEAERAYRELLARLMPLGRPRDAARAAEMLGQVLRSMGRFKEALDVFQQAADAYQRDGDNEGQWRVGVDEIGWIYFRRGMYAEGLAYVRSLVEAAGPSVSPLQVAVALTALVPHERNTGQHRAARVTAARALELARAVGDDALLAQQAFTSGRVLLDEGRTDEALQLAEEFLPLAERLGDPQRLMPVLHIFAASYLLRGEFAKSRVYRERALEVAERVGDWGNARFYLSSRGRLNFLSGNWRAARADAERAVSLYRQIGTAGPPQPLLLLGELCLAEGRWDEARSLLAEGLACAERIGEPERIILAHAVLAEWELLERHPQAAWARLEPLLDPPDREEVFLIPLWTVMAWAALDLGNEEQAATLLEQALTRARTHQLRFSLVDPLRIQAQLCLRQKRWSEAQAALEEALTLCRAMPYPYAEAKTLFISGLVQQAKGDLTQARMRLEAALALLNQLGERLYAEQIMQTLTALER